MRYGPPRRSARPPIGLGFAVCPLAIVVGFPDDVLVAGVSTARENLWIPRRAAGAVSMDIRATVAPPVDPG